MTQNNTNHLFKEFSVDSKLIINLLQSFKQSTLWYRVDGFDMLDIEKIFWSKESLLKLINDKFPIKFCAVIKMDPFTEYNWHTDFTRGFTINMLMENQASYCLFGDTLDEFNDSITILPYKIGRFYLFNTQHRHSVINFENPRYLFSIQFEQEKDELSYQEVYNWCLSQGLFYE